MIQSFFSASEREKKKKPDENVYFEGEKWRPIHNLLVDQLYTVLLI
jgi:hypothetical protein